MEISPNTPIVPLPHILPEELAGKISPKKLEELVKYILNEGVQRRFSKDYVTGQLQTLIKTNPRAAKSLGWPEDFQGIKTTLVLPHFPPAPTSVPETHRMEPLADY